MTKIFIRGNVASSKNSKRIVGRGKGVRLIWSKTAEKYRKESKTQWEEAKETFEQAIKGKEMPYRISFKFVRNSRRKFDYPNPLQTVLDLMVKYEWLEDDNADVILPSFEPYEYDPDNSGVEIVVL